MCGEDKSLRKQQKPEISLDLISAVSVAMVITLIIVSVAVVITLNTQKGLAPFFGVFVRK